MLSWGREWGDLCTRVSTFVHTHFLFRVRTFFYRFTARCSSRRVSTPISEHGRPPPRRFSTNAPALWSRESRGRGREKRKAMSAESFPFVDSRVQWLDALNILGVGQACREGRREGRG